MDLEDAANIGYISGKHGEEKAFPYLKAYCLQTNISQEEVLTLMTLAQKKFEEMEGEL